MSLSNCTEHVTASQCKLSPKKRSEQMFRLMKQLVQNNTHVDDKKGILVEKIIFCDDQKIHSKCKNFEFWFPFKTCNVYLSQPETNTKRETCFNFLPVSLLQKMKQKPECLRVNNLSLIRLKWESLNGCYRITKHVIFRKTKNKDFLPPNTHTLVCVTGDKCSSFTQFGVLCFLLTPILKFVLLPYYRRTWGSQRHHNLHV